MAKTVGGIGVVNVRELSRETSKILEQIEEGVHFLVTHRGRPVATLSPIPLDALEDFVLANHRDFISARQEADDDFAAGGGTSLDEILDPEAVMVARLEDAGLVEEEEEPSTDMAGLKGSSPGRPS